MREYGAVLSRGGAGETFRIETLTAADTLQIPEVGTRVPVRELYQGMDFPEEG